LQVGITTLTSGVEGFTSGTAVPKTRGECLEVAAVAGGDVVDPSELIRGKTVRRSAGPSDVARNLAEAVEEHAEYQTGEDRRRDDAAASSLAHLTDAVCEPDEWDQR
jgi:hypothetical protein